MIFSYQGLSTVLGFECWVRIAVLLFEFVLQLCKWVCETFLKHFSNLRVHSSTFRFQGPSSYPNLVCTYSRIFAPRVYKIAHVDYKIVCFVELEIYGSWIR